MLSTETYQKRNQVGLIQSGEEFLSRLESLIRTAKSEIHIQTYIFEPDETGRRIMAALKEAALIRNVKIFIIVDAYGSQNLSKAHRKDLRQAGIRIKQFGRLYSRGSFHIGRRLHQKIYVADGRVAMVGGINISDKYAVQEASPAWLDFAVEVQGDTARRLMLICRKRWMNTRFRSFKGKLRHGIINHDTSRFDAVKVRVSQNDYIKRKNEIALGYRQKIRTCRNSLTIVGGYFLPGGKIRRLLKAAVQRGVKIRIIVSDHSDVKLVSYARRYLYSWLLRNQISIYEYLPSNVHGKVLISDEKYVSIGSYDLNNLSTYSNIELNLDIEDENFAGLFVRRLDEIISKDCHLVTASDFQKRFTAFHLFLSWVSYQVVKTLFVLSLLLAKKSE